MSGGDGEPGDTEYGHWRSGVERPESGTEQVEVLHGFVHVCGVDVEPCDVGETHVGGAQDGLEVVEGERHLAPHVPGVLRVAFGIDRGLTCTDQLPTSSIEYFSLIVAEIQRPRPWVDWCSIHTLYLLIISFAVI